MSCSDDKKCQALFAIISANSKFSNITTAASNNNENSVTFQTNSIITTTPVHAITKALISTSSQHSPPLNNTANLLSFNEDFQLSIAQDLCRCITLSYRCLLESKIEKNEISSEITKNVFLILYLVLMVMSLAINLITFVLIVNDHKKFFRKILKKTRKNNQSDSNTNNSCQSGARTKSSQISSLNNISDLLMFNLLISNLIITLYVLPNQIHLFYTNTHLIYNDCQIGEFLKAFSVSLSIYSLVSISFQRLIVIK